MVKKSPITDRLDDMVRESSKLIDNYQKHERELSKLNYFIRNYFSKIYTMEKFQEILSIKEKLEMITLDFRVFKREYQNEFDDLMQGYIDKYDAYLSAVISLMNKRLKLQSVLLDENGTLLGNLAAIRDIKNAIRFCLQSGIEVNKIAVQIQQKT
jgi:hypothetical protein